MDIKELTNLLVTSSEIYCQNQFIPWWEADHKSHTYYYNIFSEDTIQGATACVAECGKEDLLAPVGSKGLTVFHLLVWHNFHDAVELILRTGKITGTQVDTPDHKGHGLTPFLMACWRGNLKLARLLMEYGADSSLSDGQNHNVYHFLAYPKSQEVEYDATYLEYCVEQRAEIARLLTCDVNQQDVDGITPLVRLLSSTYSSDYNWPLTEIFLDKGAKTDYVNDDGDTLLMMAIKNNHMAAALQLMGRCKSMVTAANKNGDTPLEYISDGYNTALRLALMYHGASSANRVDLEELCEAADYAFGRVSRSNRDYMGLALYLSRKLIQQVDPDDEDELYYIKDLLQEALKVDQKCRILDFCHEARLDFTAPLYCSGEKICLRDECLDNLPRADIVRKMIDLGIDMDVDVVSGKTPAVILASMSKWDEEDEAMLEETAGLLGAESMERTDNAGKSAVHYAAANGHTGMLRVMLEKGVNPDLTEDKPADSGATPLHEACAHGHDDTVKLLMAAGADDTAQNIKGETPAHFAMMEKYSRTLTPEKRIQLLRELKHIDIPREDGKTPLLMMPDSSEAEELLPILIDKGADVNHADNEGMTALMLYRSKDISKELLRAGADINKKDNEGNTALHWSLEEYNTHNARYLIKKGADYNLTNCQGRTPVQIAVEKGFEDVLELMTDIK